MRLWSGKDKHRERETVIYRRSNESPLLSELAQKEDSSRAKRHISNDQLFIQYDASVVCEYSKNNL